MTVRREGQQSTLAEQFRKLCRDQDLPPDVFAFLNSVPSAPLKAKAEVLLVDQALRIEAGCLRPVEEYFVRCPDVAESEALSLELVAGEFHQRTQHGEKISPATFLARFPRLQNHLALLLDSLSSEESPGDATVDVPMDCLTESPADATVDVPMDLLCDEDGQPTLNVSADSILQQLDEDGQQTLAVSADSILSRLDEEHQESQPDHPRSTVEWEPTAEGMQPPHRAIGDTAHDTSNETMDIDPHSLGDMLGRFGTIEVSDSKHAQGRNRRERAANSHDTLFEEGAAYDTDRQLEEFGEYELLGEIARGGMGVVFKARQRKLKRIVALKMILAGNLADAEDIRRFYAEAEAAAALDHPNIVPVYEVGEYRGQHYFSMGYVEGQSLADKIADHPLSARDAAQMMKQVAESVEYAHQHGVIHRDLKPANVLLDGQGQPKITDFGLAKRTEAEAELTHTGQIMGTPSYMSPEQVSGDSRQVGPRSDVFAMGGMLYCLLTGRPPFQAPTLLDLLKQVKHQEPVSPRRLTSNLPVDLETICLKCLAKEPGRRYQSAKEFAEDLDRFLKGMPVVARPVSQAERVWRWCKRYPAVAGLIAAVILSLMAGATVSTYYAIAANRRAQEALQQSARAERNFERAEQNFQKAQAAVDQFFVQVSENTLLNQPGMQPLQHELLKQALEYYQAFLAERGDDPDLQDELAVTQFRVGIITEIVQSPEAAIPSLEKARDLQTALIKAHPDDPTLPQGLGDTLTALGRVYHRTKSFRRAEEMFQKASEIRQRVADNQPQNPEVQRELANAYMNLGLVERARAESLPDAQEHAASLATARTFYEKSQQIRRDVLKQEALSPEILRKVHRDLGQGGYNLGTIHFQMGDTQPGLDSYREAVTDFKAALELEPEDQKTTLALAICLHALAKSETDLERAWQYGQEALDWLDPLVRANPDVEDYQTELILAKADLGVTPHDRTKDAHAIRLLKDARTGLDKLRKSDPHNRKLLLKAITVYRHLWPLATAEEVDSAADPLVKNTQQIVQEIEQKVIEQNQGGALRGDFAVELLFLVQPLNRNGHSELALKVSQEGVTLAGRLAKDEPTNLTYHQNYQFGLGQRAQLLIAKERYGEAHATLRQAVEALSDFAHQISRQPEIVSKHPNLMSELQFEEAKTYNTLARLSLLQKHTQPAHQELDQATELLDSLIAQFPAHQAFFEQELKRTQSLRNQLPSIPAVAEKPEAKSITRMSQKKTP